jgi:agmatine/peptidylarginine deiminase
LISDIDQYNDLLIRKINGLRIKWLKFDTAKKHKMRWAYLNFIQMENALLVPKLGIDEDEQAFNKIKDFYKDYVDTKRIVQVEIRDLVNMEAAG